MKILHLLSFIPQIPFKIITVACLVIAWVSERISEWFHDAFSYPIWLKLHYRKIAELRK